MAEGSEDPDYIDIRLKASEGECELLIALLANAYLEVCQTRDEEQMAGCRALLENIFNQIKEKRDFMLCIIAKAMLDKAEQQAKSDK